MNRPGLAVLASPLPGTRWYFAAQAAGAGAQQLLYILNPNAVPAPVTVTYYRDHTAALLSARLIVPAASTAIEDVGADIGPLSDQGVSIVVNSPRVISVARVLRRAGAGAAILNADITPGVMAPARQWLFAEGYIGLTYHEYLTLFNPNPASARVTVRFAPQGVSVPAIAPVTLVVPALGQALLDVGRAYRRASVKSVGLRVTSDAPVVAARTLYWGQSLGRSQFGADARSGAPAASTNWDFAGVSVAGDDQPFLTVLAPRGAAHVTAWLHAANGRLLATLRMRVESGQRATLRLLIRQQAGLGPIGVTVRADTPVVAEMPQYNAGSPNVTHHAGDVITGVIDGARYAHLPYLNTTGHAVAALIDVYNPGQSPLNVTVEGFTNRGRQATAHLVVDGGHTALYDVAWLGLPRGVLGATLTADGPFVAYAQGAAGAAAEFLSEPAIPLPIEARQAVLAQATPTAMTAGAHPIAPLIIPSATPSPSATMTSSPINTPTPAATSTSSPINTPTPVATSTGTIQPAATSTSTAAPAATAASTPIPTNTAANATPTPVATRTPLPLLTPAQTETPTATATSAPTATPTSTSTSTAIPTSTPTAIPTSTPTAIPTNTPTSAPTSSPTNTATPTNTPTSMPTSTATTAPTSATTSTPTSTPTATSTSAPTATQTPPALPAATATLTPTSTATSTATETPSVLPSVTVTSTSTITAMDTPTSATETATPTSTATATQTAAPTGTATPADTATNTPTNTPTATSTPVFQTHGINVSVGYADSLRPSPDLPVPWKGAPHTVFIGADPSGHQYDGGAIKLDNTTSAPISVTGVTVYFPNHNMNPQTYNLWGSFEIPANSSAILAETNGNNFDVSDYGINGIVCGNMAGQDNNPPQIMLKVSDAITTTLADTGHVLDTGGFDPGLACAANNESLQWRAIGTGGATASSGNLTLEPLSATVGTSATTTLVARLSDAAGVLPLFNAQVDFNVVSGPNAGQAGHVLTDADGVARFSYTSTVTGTDTVQASVTNISNGTFYSNPATVVWAAPPPAFAGSLTLDPTDSVTATINGLQPFTVTALDGAGNAMPNLSVTLAITGANAATFTKTTNARGQAAFAYSGKTTGLDSVQALATADGSSLFSGVATVRWGLPPGALAINAGGGVAGGFQADTDYTGGWYFFAPSTHRIDTSGVATNNPAPQAVYQTARCGNFSYTFPHLTPGAPYTVRLHFAEAFPATSCPYSNNGQPVATVGQRVFDVALNGTTFLHNFDIVATAGAPYKAIIEQAALPADSNGTIVVQATSTVGQAIINGVELIPGRSGLPTVTLSPTGTVTNTVNVGQVFTATVRDASDAPIGGATVSLRVTGANGATAGQPSAVTDATGVATLVYTGTVTGLDTVSVVARVGRTQVLDAQTTAVYWQLPAGDVAINAGGPAVDDFMADTDAIGGGQSGDGNTIDTSGVDHPAPPRVYQTFRYDYNGFSYRVPGLVPGASYTVRLHFAERDYNHAGGRIFDVAVNGAPMLRHFDIFAAAVAQNRAVIEQAVAQADVSGTITIAVSAIRDYAQLNALEIIPVTTAAPTLALSPMGTLTDTVDAAQSFTATLRDGSGNPLVNTPVTLTVNGANNQAITGTTNAQGQASLVYTGTVTGQDHVGASAQVAGATYLSAGTAVYWQLPATELAIDSGGPAAGDFMADTDAAGGNTTSRGEPIDTSGVTDPAPQTVYQTERYGNFSYIIPNLTPGGTYRVRLHFAELFDNGPGQRLFNVALNDTQVLTNFDIFATTGGMYRALVEEYTTTADANGQITVQYTTLRDQAKSSGIEVIPVTPAPTLALSPSSPLTHTISASQAFTATLRDAGGHPLAGSPVTLTINGANSQVITGTTGAQGQAAFVYTGTMTGLDSVGAFAVVGGATVVASGTTVYWQLPTGDVAINGGGGAVGDFVADTDVVGGGQSGDGNAIDTSGVVDPAPQAVYQSFHYDGAIFSYHVPNLTPGAAYTVRLHFSERDSNGPGQRLFNVALNGAQVLTNFDVFATAGGQNRAVIEQFNAQADVSGTIGLTFTAVQNYAFVNGIEIIPQPQPSPSLTLSPSGTVNNTIYHQQAITATARDGAGQPLANLPVALTIRGPNAPNDRVLHGVTDAQGQARFTYVGTSSGTDAVHATTAYLPAVGAYLTSDTLVVRWVQMPGYVAINAGGPQVSDFITDTDVSGGGQAGGYCCTIDTSGALNPAPQGVYQTFHYDFNGFSYQIPGLTPNAPYLVRLHFADRDHNTPGQRLFNVSINSIPVLTNFDVAAAAGGQNRAVVEQLAQPADGSGTMTIAFSAVRDYAFVNGIELIPLDSLPGARVTLSPSGPLTNTINMLQTFTATARDAAGAPLTNTPLTSTVSGSNPQTLTATTDGQGQATFSYIGRTTGTDVVYAAPDVANTYLVTPVRVYWQLPAGDIAINAGGPTIADFVTDTDGSGGGQAGGYCCVVDTSGAVNPAPPQVYQTFRYDFGGFSYNVPGLTHGAAYTVRLHFADRDHNDVGGRLMNVSINGTPVLTNFDVTAAAGGRNRAVVEQFAAQADTSGTMTIAFSAVRDYAFVNAIEVIPGAFVSAPTPTPTDTGTPTATPTQTSTPGPASTPTQTSTPGPTSTPGSPTATIPPTINPQETVQANITSPAQTNTGGDPQVSGLVPVTGTADVLNGSGLQSYVVSYAPQNSTGNQSFTTAFSGTGPVDNGLLGHFDTTALPNGLYTLQLVVTANDGQTSVSAVNVAVTGQLKIGNLSFTVTDLAVPVLGIPIQIDRTYDNFRRSGGDFGVDWTLGLRTVDVQQDTCTADIALTLPSGQRIIFSFSPQGTQAPGYFTPSWAPDPTSGDRLSTDYNSISQDSSTGCWVSPDDGSPYVPAHLYLDTPDGMRYVINHNIDTFGTGQETSSLREIDERNGAVLSFSASGVSSNKGPGVTIARDGQGRVTSVTDPLSNTITYSYNAAGDLASVTDRDGAATTYHYDSQHNLLSQTDPLGHTPAIAHYDSQGRLTSVTDSQGHTITYTVDLAAHQQVVTDQRGYATVNEYDDYGDLLKTVDPLGNATTFTYDPVTHQRLTMTDPLSHTTTLAYDANSRLTSIMDPLGNSTTYAYDANGHVSSTSMNGSAPTTLTYGPTGDPTSYADPLGQTTVFTPNAAGLPVAMTDPLSGTTAISYTATGLLQAYTDAAGQTKSYTRDALGRITARTIDGQTTTQTYDNEGDVLSTTDPLGHTTYNNYDADGQLISTTDALSRTTTFQYDAQGHQIRTGYPDGSMTMQAYDAAGNMIASTDQNGATTRYQYDPNNRLVETDYPDGSHTTVTYDAAGRRIATTDGAGNTTRYGYDDAGRPISVTDALSNTATYSYDAAGNRASMTDPSGHVTTYHYDGGHRLIGTSSVLSTNGVTSTVATTTTYNALNQVATRTDPDGRATTYSYDPGHRLNGVDGPGAGQTTYTHDAQGNLAVQTDANGHTTTYTYDALDQPVGVTYADGSATSQTYDANGNVSSATNARGQTATYSYDSMNRVAQAVYADHTLTYAYYPGGQTRAITDTLTGAGIPSVSQYGIDAMGRVITATTPQGTITYTYDGAGHRLSMTTPGGTTRYTYDADGRLSTVTDPRDQTTTYTYDANGNLASRTLPNGTTTTYSYDALNRLTGQQTTTGGGTTLYQEQDTVDPASLRTGARQTDASGVVTTSTYGYDAAGRLDAERQVRGTATVLDDSYSFDNVGNRMTKDSLAGATTYQYNARDELVSSSGPGGAASYSYDADGNLTSRTVGGVTTLYTYDSQNRLLTVGVQGAATLQASYLYDALGNRVSVMDGQGHITAVLFDTQTSLAQVVREITSDGTPTDYVYGLDRINLTRGGATSDYLYDGHGNTAALIDAATAVVQDAYRYDAYGNLLAQTGAVANSFLYEGQQFDASTGLYDLRARYTDPATGRFLSVDPLAGSPQDPVTLHRYLYANDDPVQFSDPSGQESLFSLGVAQIVNNIVEQGLKVLIRFKGAAVSQVTQAAVNGGAIASVGVNLTSAVGEINTLVTGDRLTVLTGATALWGYTSSNVPYLLGCKGLAGSSGVAALAAGIVALGCNAAQVKYPQFAPGLLPQMLGAASDGQIYSNFGLNLVAYFAIQAGAEFSSFRSQDGSKGTPLVECGC